MQASMIRRWLHELEPMNHSENLGPPQSMWLFPTNPKPENIRCKRKYWSSHPGATDFFFSDAARRNIQLRPSGQGGGGTVHSSIKYEVGSNGVTEKWAGGFGESGTKTSNGRGHYTWYFIRERLRSRDAFTKKMINVTCEYDRWVVETQLCKLRDTSDTLIARACAMFHLHYGVCELNLR